MRAAAPALKRAGWKNRAITLAVAALATLPGMAGAAEPPCLTPAEFSALATYALPGIISDVAHRCAASLPAGAFLPGNGDALAGRWGTAGPVVWPVAKAAFLKLSAGAGPDAAAMLHNMPDDSLQQLVAMAASQYAGQKLPTERCDTIDAAARALAPLPPENIGQLLAVLVSLAPRAELVGPNALSGRAGKLAICRATPNPAALTPLASGAFQAQIPPAASAGKP